VTGKLVRYLVEEGAEVKAGQPFAEAEAMKMLITIRAAAAGKLSQALQAGSIINQGDLLATLELKDPSKVRIERTQWVDEIKKNRWGMALAGWQHSDPMTPQIQNIDSDRGVTRRWNSATCPGGHFPMLAPSARRHVRALSGGKTDPLDPLSP
jgi:pyruvate/2-oxoglutarate dehydrogenase complex dihydrolipoamide acyltransferase (E2) component